MNQDYLRTILRNMLSHRLYATINVGGLAVGLAATILILMFVRTETSYESWIPGADRIYSLQMKLVAPGRPPFDTVMTSGPMRDVVPEKFPEFEAAARLVRQREAVRAGDAETFYEIVAYADANFLSVVQLPLAIGDARALEDANAVVLSERLAEKYFGSENPIGRTITLNDRTDFRVVAVMKNLPENTHFSLDMLIPITPERFIDQPWILDQWVSANTYTYARLRDGANIDSARARLTDFIANTIPVQPIPGGEAKASDFMSLSWVPMTDIHLGTPHKVNHMKPVGDASTVYTFVAVAALVLIIASINFMNLATARSLQRAREVSLRKLFGARRKQLIAQILAESVLTVMVALVVALMLVALALPLYNLLLGKSLSFGLLFEPVALGLMLMVSLTLGLMSGLYPAFYLTRFLPAEILKANRSSQFAGSGRLRTVLVVLQFAISIALVVCTTVVYGQTLYVQSMDLGFVKENAIVLRGMGRPNALERREALMEEIRKLPGVSDVALTSEVPTDGGESNTAALVPGLVTDSPIVLGRILADYGLVETLGMRLAAGRSLSRDHGDDRLEYDPANVAGTLSASTNVLINEAAVRQLGFGTPADAIGKLFKADPIPGQGITLVDMTVVGVVRDHHENSARLGIRPLVYVHDPRQFSALVVRINGDPQAASNSIGTVWRAALPTVPYLAEFLEDRVAAQYAQDIARGRLFAVFALLAVFIACLGLFGLASFTTERRTREIGIRKVLGATTIDIVRLMLWQFSQPVVASNLFAWPVAYYAMRAWLDGFEYRIDLNAVPFLTAGLTALLISWLTVGFHSYRAARTNPGRSLRYE